MKTAVFMAKYRQLISQSDHRISLAYEIIHNITNITSIRIYYKYSNILQVFEYITNIRIYYKYYKLLQIFEYFLGKAYKFEYSDIPLGYFNSVFLF